MKSRTKYDLDLNLWPWPWKVHTRSKFLKHQLRKTSQNMLGYYAQDIIYGWCQRWRQGWAISQIHLIDYNFASNCHRDFKLVSYFSLWNAAPNMTLTLKSSTKVKIFETYQIRKTSQNMLGYYAQGIIYCWEVKGQGQGQAKGQIHLISYNFASNCHRDFKLGLYFNLWKGASNMTLTFTFDLDLEKFNQGQKFGNIN